VQQGLANLTRGRVSVGLGRIISSTDELLEQANSGRRERSRPVLRVHGNLSALARCTVEPRGVQRESTPAPGVSGYANIRTGISSICEASRPFSQKGWLPGCCTSRPKTHVSVCGPQSGSPRDESLRDRLRSTALSALVVCRVRSQRTMMERFYGMHRGLGNRS
jgi:hypothetical protein